MHAREDLLRNDLTVLDHVDLAQAHIASSTVVRRIALAKVLDDFAVPTDGGFAEAYDFIELLE
jgi:hypothetical protein